MRRIHNILLALFSVLLFGHSLVQGDPMVEKRSAVVSPAGERSAESTHPLAQPNLLNAFHQAESVINTNNIPAPWLSVEEREQSAVHKFIVSASENRTAVCLKIYDSIDRAPISLKYIFPFHVFL